MQKGLHLQICAENRMKLLRNTGRNTLVFDTTTRSYERLLRIWDMLSPNNKRFVEVFSKDNEKSVVREFLADQTKSLKIAVLSTNSFHYVYCVNMINHI